MTFPEVKAPRLKAVLAGITARYGSLTLDFLAKYKLLIPPSTRSHVLTAKPQAMDNGGEVLIWDDANAEFSFEFAYVEGRGYRVSSFSIGPR